MKKLFFIIILLSSFFSNAQDSYILKKDGTKMEINKNKYYHMSFNKVRYTSGSRFVKGIDIDEVEKLVSGDITYIPFEIIVKEKKHTFFYKIVAESNDKMLLVSFNPSVHDQGPARFVYYYKIVEKLTNTIIDEGGFIESKFANKLPDQKEAFTKIRANFSDCPEIMNSLSEFEKKLPTAKIGLGYSESYIAGFMYQEKTLRCN